MTVSALRSLTGRLGRVQLVSLAIAIAWGAALVVGALVAPVYQTSSVSSSGAAAAGSATLLAVNGWHVVLVAAAPLAAALITGGMLWRRNGRRGAGAFAWVASGLLGCFNLLAMLSIGLFVLPVTVALLVACGSHGQRPPGVATGLGI
jgi:hypothetical protein